jgi:hypothetical protein
MAQRAEMRSILVAVARATALRLDRCVGERDHQVDRVRLIELIFPSGLEDAFREMAALTIDMAMAGQDANRRSAISARYGTTPHFDLLQEFAQSHRIPLPPGFARR